MKRFARSILERTLWNQPEFSQRVSISNGEIHPLVFDRRSGKLTREGKETKKELLETYSYSLHRVERFSFVCAKRIVPLEKLSSKVLVFFHGAGGTILERKEYYDILGDATGVNFVLGVEYEGFSQGDGRDLVTDSKLLVENSKRFYQWLSAFGKDYFIRECKFSCFEKVDEIIYSGHCTGMISALAPLKEKKMKIAGIVGVSPMMSVRDFLHSSSGKLWISWLSFGLIEYGIGNYLDDCFMKPIKDNSTIPFCLLFPENDWLTTLRFGTVHFMGYKNVCIIRIPNAHHCTKWKTWDPLVLAKVKGWVETLL